MVQALPVESLGYILGNLGILLTRVSKCIDNVVGGNIRMDNNSQFLHNEHNNFTGYPSLIQPVMYT